MSTALVIAGTALQVVGVSIALVGVHHLAQGLRYREALWYVRLWRWLRRKPRMHYVESSDAIQATDAVVSTRVTRSEPKPDAPFSEWVAYFKTRLAEVERYVDEANEQAR